MKTNAIHTSRPIRYRNSRTLSNLVDLLQEQEDTLRAAGDLANARRIAAARCRVVDVATGISPGARG